MERAADHRPDTIGRHDHIRVDRFPTVEMQDRTTRLDVDSRRPRSEPQALATERVEQDAVKDRSQHDDRRFGKERSRDGRIERSQDAAATAPHLDDARDCPAGDDRIGNAEPP
jgi:hypothetical protein